MEKTRLEQVQDRLGLVFAGLAMSVFLATGAVACGWVSYRSGEEGLACVLWLVAWLLVTAMLWCWRRFMALGAEEERLSLQQPEDPLSEPLEGSGG